MHEEKPVAVRKLEWVVWKSILNISQISQAFLKLWMMHLINFLYEVSLYT